MTQGQANNRDVLVELVAATTDDEAILHLRLPRGETVSDAVLSQDEMELLLEIDRDSLNYTQFIILDASREMENLLPVVQSNVQRLWQTGEQPTGVILFDDDVEVLQPTTRTDDINDFLTTYAVSPNLTTCLGDAINEIDSIERDFEQSWRILLITVGNLSDTTSCENQTLAQAPAAVEVIVLNADINPNLQDWVAASGGQVVTANRRSVGTTLNDIITQWGQPTYRLSGNLPDGWDTNKDFTLDITLSNGETYDFFLSFQTYTQPTPDATIAPATATPIAATELAAPLATEANTSTPTDTSNTTNATQNLFDNEGVAVLIIIGAVLFVIGAVVLALALARVRRKPTVTAPAPSQNFYETLAAAQPSLQEGDTGTSARQQKVAPPAIQDPQTQLAMLEDTALFEEGDTIDEHDQLLVTQVLTDERFRSMMEQSQSNDEVIGWIRLLIDGRDLEADHELTRRGMVIGRSQDCDVQITGDSAISRQHARLDVRSNNQVTVSRLSAVNPVVVGGVQISNRHPLESNDVIHLSDETRLIFIARQIDDDTPDTQA